MEPFSLAGHLIAPNARARVDLPLGRLPTHTPMSLPLVVVHGGQPGPCVFVSAAIHGDEINGIEIISRLLASDGLAQMAGTLIAAPLVNGYGFLNANRYLPDRRDLNRCFPGSPDGPLANQIAHVFLNEVVRRCVAGIDLHTGAIHRANAPQVRADLDNAHAQDLALAFGAPIIMNAELRDGSLRDAAHKLGVPVIVYEGGEALRFDEHAIAQGLAGTLRVLAHLGMIAPQPRPNASLLARKSRWIRAPIAGLVRGAVGLGAQVQKGEILGRVAGPLDEDSQNLIAPFEGVVIGSSALPVVHAGDALFHLAALGEIDDATDSGADDQATEPPLWSGSRT